MMISALQPARTEMQLQDVCLRQNTCYDIHRFSIDVLIGTFTKREKQVLIVQPDPLHTFASELAFRRARSLSATGARSTGLCKGLNRPAVRRAR